MPRPSKRKRPRTAVAKAVQWGGPQPAARNRRVNLAIAAVAVALLVGGAVWGWQTFGTWWSFRTLAERGSAALANVQNFPDRGRDHLESGQVYAYAERFPTSGPHDPTPTRPGVYDAAQPPTRLVHALEHGNIVIYYDRPDATALDTLRGWTDLYDGTWDGIVLTPAAGLGEAVVLTAWTRLLRLEPFDPAAAAAFIDAYRGRGPENPVR